MLYLNKLLMNVKNDSKIFKSQEIILKLGLTNTQIKNLKKYALENQLITQIKQEYFLTEKGEKYIISNPLKKWSNKDFPLRPEINVEDLKESKTPANITKAIRLLAKNLLINLPLKSFSLEEALINDLKACDRLKTLVEKEILSGNRLCIEEIFVKYYEKGITKSLISIILLKVLTENLERIAIYEKTQFQLKLDPLMFERMIACPQNFEIQKTEMPNLEILKELSKTILDKESANILEITKGLYRIIKNLDKYTMNTQNLTEKTLRLRNIIINAKDPLSLFERDIPKVFNENSLKTCSLNFINNLENSLNELKNCTNKLVNDLNTFIFNSFKAISKEELANRFQAVAEYIGENELKILFNNIIEKDIDNELWTNRIATFINKYRVPKDWNDEDYANFKLKTKELALKFFVIESTVGISESMATKNYEIVLNSFLKLPKEEQFLMLRKFINI